MNITRETVEPAMRAAAETVCKEHADIIPSDTRNLMGFYASLRRLLVEVCYPTTMIGQNVEGSTIANGLPVSAGSTTFPFPISFVPRTTASSEFSPTLSTLSVSAKLRPSPSTNTSTRSKPPNPASIRSTWKTKTWRPGSKRCSRSGR